MLGLPQGKTRFARGDDDALGLQLIHFRRLTKMVVVRMVVRAVLLILAWLPMAPCAAPAGIAPARDLALDAADMRTRGIVMLVLFSQDGCRWCERARTEILIPLQNDPASRRRVVLRDIALDVDAPLTDFAGRKTTHRRFAAGEGARVTPTLIVYGPDGRRLAEPIVGFLTADFYAEHVNRAVEEGLARLRSPSSAD